MPDSSDLQGHRVTRPVATTEPIAAIALFLSNGGSLAKWKREGLLLRELAVYRYYLQQGLIQRLIIFSYSCEDKALLDALIASDPVYRQVHLVAPRKTKNVAGLKAAMISLLWTLQRRSELSDASIIKTNQFSGAWAATFASILTGKPLFLRMGYILSRRMRLNGKRGLANVIKVLERVLFSFAERIAVTSEDALTIVAATGVFAKKLALVPSYVDTDLFGPHQIYDPRLPALFVGRLTPQKNPENMVTACVRAGLALDIVGAGALQERLAAQVAQADPPIRLLGPKQNEEIAALMRERTFFLLPSLHEGLPKALLEAMAAGMVCIAARIPGVTDLIEDGVTGILIEGHEPDDIAHAISRALVADHARLGSAARALVLARFGLPAYASRELAVISNCLGQSYS